MPLPNGKAPSTINLKNPFNNFPPKAEPPKDNGGGLTPNKQIAYEDLVSAWKEFTELRKNQIAEYNLLKKDFNLDGETITIMLSNPIEEPLLRNIRVQLIAFLRSKLNNHAITVVSILQESEAKKIAYTGKEKFDFLAGKNPFLKELKERLGLDTDF